MLPLRVYKAVADSTVLTAIAIAAELISFAGMTTRADRVNALGAGLCPDLWFGYTPERLNGWYNGIGEDGCILYQSVAHWDLFPYMVSYTILIGSILVRVARSTKNPLAIAHIMSVTLIMDIIESSVQLRGCQIYPNSRLDDRIVAIGSAANQMKWVLFTVALASIPVMFFLTWGRKREESESKNQ